MILHGDDKLFFKHRWKVELWIFIRWKFKVLRYREKTGKIDDEKFLFRH